MNTDPFWFAGRDRPAFAPLDCDLEVDILVVGGGIAGLTAAYLLSVEGRSVALVERDQLGGLNTGHTTAHLTYMTDTRLSELVATCSRGEARRAWEAGQAAITFIEETAKRHEIDCGFVRVPGFLVAAEVCDLEQETKLLQQEAMVARQFGFHAYFLDADPVLGRPAIRFEDQAKFHPLRYVDGLARVTAAGGAKIFEHTEVTAVEDERRLIANGRTIRFHEVFFATHVPLQGSAGTFGAALFQTKLGLYSSYAVRARLTGARLPELIWSDTADPFHYLRVEHDADGISCIFGGEDHKTGDETHTEQCYADLERYLDKILPGAEVTHRWSGQIVEPVDGLPYIGRGSENQWVATGFSGNGMTFGTVAGVMIRDAMTNRSNPWEKVFDPGRKTASALADYLREHKDYPVRLIADRFGVEEGDPASLAPGSGKLMEHDGKRVAAFRDDGGALQTCSAVCPHLGCIVAWNDAEQTWDCPCHGSRFKANGDLLAGPAEKGLERLK
jgi:glycine/D-amino acid oxidase-like deaminating enzyme/nitrite reductase/ring-hydroxylating ferredoxin subunit